MNKMIKYFKRYYRRLRGVGLRNVIIILAWGFLLGFILSVSVQKMDYISGKQNILLRISPVFYAFGFSAMVPSASLLAEVVISRYKLVSFSLKAMWLLSVLNCAAEVVEDFLPSNISQILFIVEVYLLIFPRFILFGAFLPGALPLGIDQIIIGTADNISAFILWLAWGVFCGITISEHTTTIFKCLQFKADDVYTLVTLSSVLLLSVGLIIDIFFNHKLVKEPVTVNPVTLIFKVLKYAAKHKYPVRRSAFTYCDNQQPSRLDYGKSKYGGPFTTEQVEDVKTFWRMLLVIFTVICMFHWNVRPTILMATEHQNSVTNLKQSFGIITTRQRQLFAFREL